MPLLRRYWYAPVGAAVVALAVAFGPWLFGLAKGFASGLPGKLPDVEAPRITLPKVDLPSVTIHTPSFVETAVSRIGQRLSGPLLSRPGEWLLVADVQLEGEAGFAPTPAALGLAIETDLAQARFFSVVPRERALIARRARGGAGGESLPLADALALARAEHYAVVVVPWARRVQGVDSLALRLLSPAGDTLYGVTAAVSEQGRPLETLADLLRAVRRRLGEPGGDVEASLEPSRFLTGSTEALELYAQARWHEFAGRHAQAIRAARQAVSRDSSFALAYYLLAQAQALSGQRPAARSALEMAWRFSERTTVRERMRIRGDWLVWENRQPDAAVTYDDLFSLHRDDVGALKSQAIVQRVIGARGSGEGNLKVAYTIDPYDWPPLSRIARFLGYNGRLPDVDSLVAAIQAGR
jgi:tetratricopeptide (TPR) repeat protein